MCYDQYDYSLFAIILAEFGYSEIVIPQVWLKRFQVTTYIIKGAHPFPQQPTLKNFTVKHAYCGEVLGCLTS